MLSTDQSELLSAYIDGELDADGRAKARLLLLTSREAITELRSLEATKRFVSELPRVSLPDGVFADTSECV